MRGGCAGVARGCAGLRGGCAGVARGCAGLRGRLRGGRRRVGNCSNRFGKYRNAVRKKSASLKKYSTLFRKKIAIIRKNPSGFPNSWRGSLVSGKSGTTNTHHLIRRKILISDLDSRVAPRSEIPILRTQLWWDSHSFGILSSLRNSSSGCYNQAKISKSRKRTRKWVGLIA